jgi:hypothetical protein
MSPCFLAIIFVFSQPHDDRLSEESSLIALVDEFAPGSQGSDSFTPAVSSMRAISKTSVFCVYYDEPCNPLPSEAGHIRPVQTDHIAMRKNLNSVNRETTCWRENRVLESFIVMKESRARTDAAALLGNGNSTVQGRFGLLRD